jgi:polar amino acid transport system substrate-binding protein
MEKLKDRGIKIALDDFGTGYSSLSYMRDLPFDLLKIDKSFVDTINDGPKEESFVAAIISLGKVMQFDIISEGVEEQNQLDVLKKLGCDFVQGYIWGKPLSLDRAIEVMAQN